MSLFIASPLLAPLVMLGWGASIGGLIGATAGAVKSADAIASDQTVLVVRARSEQEAARARLPRSV